jgi:protein TonB
VNKRVSVGEIIPLRPGLGRVDGLLDTVVPARTEAPQSVIDVSTALGNVVPFVRPREGHTAPVLAVPLDAPPLPRATPARERALLAAFLVVSLTLHAGVFMALWREPAPLASIGLEVMSVEIVLGATAPAGAAVTEGEQQINSADAPPTEVTEAEKAKAKATAQEQTVEVARQETAPEQSQTEAAKSETRPEPKAESAKPDESKFETSPTEVALLPQPEEQPVEKKPEPKPLRATPPKPVKDAKPAKEQRRIAAPTRENGSREAKASAPSTAANNIGVGRSDRDTNYPGLVAAHLRRYQQYPSDARSRGDQGMATVSFSLDGSGRVTSARLAHGSGIASIDQEVQAMVRRASPFPAPPSGRAQSFTVPVRFRLN